MRIRTNKRFKLLAIVLVCAAVITALVVWRWWVARAEYEFINAVAIGDIRRVEYYLDRGVNANGRFTDYRISALHIAAASGSSELVQLLIEHGADVNAKHAERGTPLHGAMIAGCLPAIKILVENGADLWAEDSSGCIPAWGVREERGPDVLRYILTRMVESEVAEDKVFPVFYVACANSFMDIVDAVWTKHIAGTPKEGRCGSTGLEIAAQQDNMELARYLLAKGAKPSEESPASTGDKIPPVYQGKARGAAWRTVLICDKVEMARLFLDNGSEPDFNRIMLTKLDVLGPGVLELLMEHFKDDKSLLLQVMRGDIHAAQAELQYWKAASSKEKPHYAGIHLAAVGGHLGLVKFYVENGIPVDLCTSDYSSPLHLATWHGHEEICSYLIEQGASLDLKGRVSLPPHVHRGTPLHAAVVRRNTRIAEMLLKAGAGVNEYFCSEGGHALDIAIRNGDVEMLDLLLGYGAKLYGKHGDTALVCAVEMGSKAVVQHLLDTGVSIDAIDGRKRLAPLCYALRQKEWDIAKLLVEKGADVNLGLSPTDYSPLMCACGDPSCDPGLLRSLIQNGADVNYRDDNGKSALHAAASNGTGEMVEILLENGADVNVANRHGETPLHRAVSSRNKSAIELLLKYGADTKARDKRGRLPLYPIARERGMVSRFFGRVRELIR